MRTECLFVKILPCEKVQKKVVFKASIRHCKCFGARMIVGPLQISRLNAPGRGDVRQHVTSSFWMRCGCARACQHCLSCVEMMMRFG
ncbi:unnamed protein product [Prunus armeniaca]